MVNMKIGNRKTVWQKYGKWILMALIVFLLIYGAIEYYEFYKTKQAIKASETYDLMISAMQKQDKVEVETQAKQLTERFSKTPYAPLAALLLAKLSIEENNLLAAKEHLQFALKNGKGSIQPIATVRLARVLADEKEYEKALTLLDKTGVPEGYKTLFEETKGDIYLMQNNKDKAREAYQGAIGAAPPGVSMTRLQLKQADLNVNVNVKEGS